MIAILLSAFAADTYCVGGYNACERERPQHVKWHHHNWVKETSGARRCFACFDEDDNTCVSSFLVKEDGAFEAVPDACPNPNAPLYSNVIGGLELIPPPPPPPPEPPPPPPPPAPVSYTPRIDRVTPGPYTAGDTVTVYASVPDGVGGVVPLRSGAVVVTAGGRTARFAALAGPTGEVVVQITLPPDASSVSVAFEPEPARLEPHESLSSPLSASRTLTVETCRYRVGVGRPGSGASFPVGEPAALEARLFEADGKTPAKAGELSLTWTVVPKGSAPIEIRSAPDGSASWTPPADLANQGVAIAVGGRADGFSACPMGESSVTVSELGLGWDTSALPTSCTVDRVCAGTGTLLLPTSPGAKARVEALLAEPTTRIELRMNGVAVPVSSAPDHRYAFSVTPERVENLAWSIAVVGARGELLVPTHEVAVRPGLTVVLPDELDFGTIPVGTAWTETCKPLDYSGSTSLDQHQFRLQVEGAEGCASEPVILFRNAWGQSDRASLAAGVQTGAHDPLRPVHDLCLVTSGCADETAPAGVVLRVTPVDPDFADQARTVRLRWDVRGRSWFVCWGWMLVPFAVAGVVAFVLYGFFKPFRFGPAVAVRVASKVADLKRNPAIPLRDLPGSGAGWYRDARLGLFASGELRRDVSGAAVVLRARGANVMLEPNGPLEMRNRRTGAFEPVVGVQAAMPGVIYRAGAVHFKVEG